MRKLFTQFYILFLLFSSILFSQNTNDEVYRIIYSLNAMQTTSITEASAVTTVLGDHIRKNFKQDFQLEFVISKNEAELAAEMEKGFAVAAVLTNEFINLKDNYNLEPAFTNETDGKVGINYLLVTHTDDKITDINQLKNFSITVWRQEYQFIPIMILDKYLNDRNLPKADKFFKEVISSSHTNNVVLPVFFKKVKAAFVSEQQIEITKELNPQIESQLHSIYNSPRLLLGLLCFNKNLDPGMKEKFSEIFTNIHKDPFGQQLLDFFSSDRLVPFKEEYLKEYLEFFAGNRNDNE